MRVTRWRKAVPILVGTAIVGSMISLPSMAHTVPIKAVPGAGQAVRGVDPGQTGCPNFAWGGTSATTDNPCAVWFQVNQPITPASTLSVFGPDDDGAAVAGTVSHRDSATAPQTGTGSLASNLPGPDTVIFTPAAALTAGSYRALALMTDDPLLGAHGQNCDENTGPTFNCFEWRFTVAPTPATPVITSPAEGGSESTRLVTVSGTAESNSVVEIRDAADAVLAEAAATAAGEFEALIPAADGANTITARATSAMATTAERKWAAYVECRDAAIDPDNALLLEEECGVAPAEALPPVATSAAVSFTADATPDTEAPELTLITPPDTIQLLEAEALVVGTATDNDQIESLHVVVTDLLSNAVTAFTVTFDKEPITDWSVSLHGIGYFTVSVTAEDRAGNASTTITTTYLSTTGNLLA
ncbi:MAG TPA: Ig-like domain-containing protein [Actinomycetota bacterium]